VNSLSPVSRRLAARLALVGAVLALIFVVSSPASASPETLKRSVENLTQWPLDLVLSPVVAGQTTYTNLRDIDDSAPVRVAYTVPGFAWLTFVQLGSACLRGVSGALEFLPGLGLVFFDADLDPLFDPAVDQEALVDFENPVYSLKFGVGYSSAGY
jgi:hypothetical protein